MRLQMASPNPVPPNFRVVAWSACVKTSKIVESLSAGIPIPGVFDHQIDQLRTDRTITDREFDKSSFREFQRVVHEIANDLAEPNSISRHRAWHIRLDNCGKVDIFKARALGEQTGDVLHDLIETNLPLLQFEPAGLDLREIKNIVDDRQQASTGGGDNLCVSM